MAGRGRGMTLPAWMTQGALAALLALLSAWPACEACAAQEVEGHQRQALDRWERPPDRPRIGLLAGLGFPVVLELVLDRQTVHWGRCLTGCPLAQGPPLQQGAPPPGWQQVRQAGLAGPHAAPVPSSLCKSTCLSANRPDARPYCCQRAQGPPGMQPGRMMGPGPAPQPIPGPLPGRPPFQSPGYGPPGGMPSGPGAPLGPGMPGVRPGGQACLRRQATDACCHQLLHACTGAWGAAGCCSSRVPARPGQDSPRLSARSMGLRSPCLPRQTCICRASICHRGPAACLTACCCAHAGLCTQADARAAGGSTRHATLPGSPIRGTCAGAAAAAGAPAAQHGPRALCTRPAPPCLPCDALRPTWPCARLLPGLGPACLLQRIRSGRPVPACSPAHSGRHCPLTAPVVCQGRCLGSLAHPRSPPLASRGLRLPRACQGRGRPPAPLAQLRPRRLPLVSPALH